MSVPVIYLFKIVDIEHDNRKIMSISLRINDIAVYEAIEHPAVVAIRERVYRGWVYELLYL